MVDGACVRDGLHQPVDGLPELKAYYKRAQDEDRKITQVKSHGNSLSIYVLDPEGNQMEIYCDTPWYVSQPVSLPLDLSQSDEEILAGVERAVRANPTFMMQDDYAEHVRGFMDAMGIARAAVVGVSLGAWVGAALALAHPVRVEKLVLVAPAGIIIDPEEERRFAEGVRKSRSSAAAEPSWETVSAALKALLLDPEALSDELVAVRLEIYRDPRMKAAMPRLLAFSLGGQALSEEQWRSLTLPVQVIAAVDAPNMFLSNARAIARTAPNAQLVEIKDCDHWAQYEQPETFNRESIAFLQEA